MLAQQRRPALGLGRRGRQLHRRVRDGGGGRRAGVVDRAQDAAGLDVRVVEGLLGRVDRPRRDAHGLQVRQRLRRRPLREPGRHHRAERLAVLAAQQVVGEARVGQQRRVVEQRRHPLEQRLACDRDQHPAVARLEDVGWAGGLPAVAAAHPVGPAQPLLDEGGVVDRQRGAQQRRLHALSAPPLLAREQRRHDAQRRGRRRVEVDVRHPGPHGLVGVARQVGVARHRLRDAVEADLVRPGPARPQRRHRAEDDLGPDGAQRVVVEAHPRDRVGRQVGDHDVGRRHQAAHDLAPLGLHRVQRQAALAAVALQEHRAGAVLRDRLYPSVLAAAQLLDADHVGAEVGQQRGAERPRDVAAEVEHAHARQHAGGVARVLRHRVLLPRAGP